MTHHIPQVCADDRYQNALSNKLFTVRPVDCCDEVAKDCYRMADAMLKVRKL